MCGIFGYVGPRASGRLLIESLKRLEYRGYDSWGIALAETNDLLIRREVGRITAAKGPALEAGRSGGFWGGIAHTRWATHGAPTVVLAAEAGILGKMLGNVQEIRARGGRVVAVAREGDREMDRLAEHTMFIPPTLDPLVPILAVILLQLLAYHIAVRRGCDVDRPRNLAKSVTVE